MTEPDERNHEVGAALVIPFEDDRGEASDPIVENVKQEFPADWSENDKARHAYKNVLLNKALVYYIPIAQPMYATLFENIPLLCGSYSADVLLDVGICVLDLDNDGMPEVAIGDMTGDSRTLHVLHYEDGVVYCHAISGLNAKDLRRDGTIILSSGINSSVYGGKLRLSFDGPNYQTNFLYWYDSNYNYYTPESADIPLSREEKNELASTGSSWVTYRCLNESVIEYELLGKGMTDQYGFFLFTPNGDGTCSVSVYGTSESPDTVTIPEAAPNGDTVTSIGERGFSGHRYYKTIKIPKNVTSIGKNAFYGCSYAYFEVAQDNPVYSSHDGSLIETKTHTLVYMGGSNANISRNCSVVSIGDYAFAGSAVSNGVKLPDGVIRVGNYAFMKSEIYALHIPLSVQVLEQNAFTYSNLQEVTYDGTMERWNWLIKGMNTEYFDFKVLCVDGVITYQDACGK